MALVDVLVPTYRRPAALAVTLAGLVGQTFRDFRLVVSDQSEDGSSLAAPEPTAVVRVLRARGHAVDLRTHLPRRGIAEQRDFLLSLCRSPYALFLDDDLVLEPDVLEGMVATLREERCGFVGSAPIGLSFARDVRPHEQALELWEGPVRPERVRPGTAEWERHKVHNAANLWHVEAVLGARLRGKRRYRVAWVGGCVLYDAEKLRDVGGFSFWRALPTQHAGEEVLAQMRLLERYGGCALIPSGVYHQELPTTVVDRAVDAPLALGTLEP